LVFDLDPGEDVAWDFVIETAFRMRGLLESEGFKPWPKLTGGKHLGLARAKAGPAVHRLSAQWPGDHGRRLKGPPGLARAVRQPSHAK
jgi:hypothetical protein